MENPYSRAGSEAASKLQFSPHNVTLSDDMVKNELKLLHDKFVLVPTDKAANNITIVCKKYYISLIQKEIESDTFEKVNLSVDNIVGKHDKFLKKIGIQMLDKNRNLPYLLIYT